MRDLIPRDTARRIIQSRRTQQQMIEALDTALPVKYDFMADWQLISEGTLPVPGDLYFITWEGAWNGKKGRWIEMAEYCQREDDPDDCYWDISHIEKRGFKNVRIIAWMELPDKWEDK